MYNPRLFLRSQRLRRRMNRGDLAARVEFERLRFDLVMARLRHHVPSLDGAARALDLGCGCGGMAAALQERGANVVAADVAAAFLDFGRRAFPALPVMRADARWLPFADGSFDMVLASSVIDHLPRPDQPLLIAESARVLRRGGILLLSFNSSLSLTAHILGIDRGSDSKITFADVRAMADGRLEVVDVLSLWERPAAVAKLPWLGERLALGALFVMVKR